MRKTWLKFNSFCNAVLNRKRLYILLTLSCLAGYVWLLIHFLNFAKGNFSNETVCIFKRITNIPCPSCGSTRSVIYLLKGDLFDSILLNPFGLIIFTILIIAPIWLIYDVTFNSNSLIEFYHRFESFLKKREVAICAISLVVMNWIWNIIKGL